MLVRRLVSGVRSSWPASAISCAWRSRDEASDRSIWLNDSARTAMSPVALIVIGVSSLVTRDVFDGGGEFAHRTQTGARHVRANHCGNDHAGHAEDDQDQPQRAEDVVGRLQRPAQNQGVVAQISDRHRDDPVVLASGGNAGTRRVAALQPGDRSSSGPSTR